MVFFMKICRASPKLKVLVCDSCVAYGELSPLLHFFRKVTLKPFTISKISGSFVSISHASKKCFNLPASCKFGTILAENKLFTHGQTFLRYSIGITG